jgi:uncharacterized protein (TIGR03435 family)
MYRFIVSAILGGSLASLVHAQAFEVTSIKPSARHAFGPITESAGEVRYQATTLLYLLGKAYGVMDAQISGPGWLQDQATFDVTAKIPASLSQDRVHQIPLMLRTMLQERFKLAVHVDQKTMPAYALVVDPKGLKMQPAAPGDATDQGCVSAYVQGGPNAIQCHIAMADFAKHLQGIIQEPLPVVDRTGLAGVYDFKLAWTGRAMLNLGQDGTRIHDALQQQLGLKLESRKEAVEVIVIDHIEKIPTED